MRQRESISIILSEVEWRYRVRLGPFTSTILAHAEGMPIEFVVTDLRIAWKQWNWKDQRLGKPDQTVGDDRLWWSGIVAAGPQPDGPIFTECTYTQSGGWMTSLYLFLTCYGAHCMFAHAAGY